MKDKVPVLLLHGTFEPFASLKSALARLSIETAQARTCQEYRQLLERTASPHLVFTDVTLPDGTWKEVVDTAESAKAPAGVIVVNRFVDDGLYVDAIYCGACDFITPPFAEADLAHVMVSAFDTILQRRNWQALTRDSRQSNSRPREMRISRAGSTAS